MFFTKLISNITSRYLKNHYNSLISNLLEKKVFDFFRLWLNKEERLILGRIGHFKGSVLLVWALGWSISSTMYKVVNIILNYTIERE